MTERTAFMKAINANPRESVIRLAFADYLAERGETVRESYFRGNYVGRGGRGGLGGLVGLGGRVGPLNSEAPIVLIPGENVLVFIPHGWILNPGREVISTGANNGDCWVELAGGQRKRLREDAEFGPLIEGGPRAPLGCMSIPWVGDLPK